VLRHATSYTYDTSDRVATRTDPVQKAASYAYDLNNNVTALTDRKGQVTASQYDALDRLSQVTYQDTSTITYTYDAGDRVTQIADSANGTITRTYDDLDRLTQETTPQGTVTYTYDADQSSGDHDSHGTDLNLSDLMGEVYNDIQHGGPIDPSRYLKTTHAEDLAAKASFDKQLGKRSVYRPGNTCRDFSMDMFERFRMAGIGSPATPPIRNVDPASPGSTVPWSSSSTER
jgi:YD repeat-containing protein